MTPSPMPLHYQQYGTQGPPLLILHGLFGSLRNWQSVSQKLAEKFTVYAVDLRNHGASPHSLEFDYDVMVVDLRALCTRLGLPSFSLLGHSMGGKLAMHFAVTHPTLVHRLVVVDIAPKAYPAHHREILNALRAFDLSTVHHRKEADPLLRDAIPDAATRHFLLSNLHCDADDCRWQFGLEGIDRNYERLMEAVPIDTPFLQPTLFVRGERSSYILPEDEPHILRDFPHAQIVTIPTAGHWIHIDAPQEFHTIVSGFL